MYSPTDLATTGSFPTRPTAQSPGRTRIRLPEPTGHPRATKLNRQRRGAQRQNTFGAVCLASCLSLFCGTELNRGADGAQRQTHEQLQMQQRRPAATAARRLRRHEAATPFFARSTRCAAPSPVGAAPAVGTAQHDFECSAAIICTSALQQVGSCTAYSCHCYVGRNGLPCWTRAGGSAALPITAGCGPAGKAC